MDQRPAEIILAETIIQKFKLSYPLDLFPFASKFANIHFVQTLPDGVDGLLFQQPCPNIPEIYLNNKNYPQRTYFTLAHELGHYFIPWHPQTTLICCSDENNQRTLYDLEKEANNFAGELLMPLHWIQELETIHDTGKIITLLTDNNISLTAACLNVAQKTSKHILITLVSTSNKFRFIPPHTKRHYSYVSNPEVHSTAINKYVFGNSTVTVYNFEPKKFQFSSHPTGQSKKLFEKYFSSRTDSPSLWRSINGSISGLRTYP